ARRLPRAADGLPGARAPRHDPLHPARGSIRHRMLVGRRPARSIQPDLARGGDAVAIDPPQWSRSRRGRATRKADPAAGGARGRERRRGGRADGARARVAGAREAVAADRPGCAHWLGCALLPVGGTALGLGRGEEVYPLADLPRHWIVLLIPGFGVSTSEAYGWYDSERQLSRAPREPQHVPGPWPSRAAQMINDLEAPIARHHPEIDQMKAALRRVGALAASMSGSGSTVFGLFQKRRDAVAAVSRLEGSGWQVLLTESLGRGDYARLAAPRK